MMDESYRDEQRHRLFARELARDDARTVDRVERAFHRANFIQKIYERCARDEANKLADLGPVNKEM